MPIASTRPNSDSVFSENPSVSITANVPTSETGTATSEIDAYAVDETIHHYHRAAAELWKFCFARGGGTHAEFTAGLLDA